MKEFFSSPTFLLSAIGLVAFGVVIALLWRNTVWEARGITPAVDVARLRTRITGLFPKSIVAWCIVAVVIIPVAVGLWGLSGTFGTPSESGTWSSSLRSPSLARVATVTQNYWLWIVVVGIIVWVYLSFIQKENEALAKTLQRVLMGVMFMLFIGLPLWSWVTSDSRQEQKQREKPVLSMPANGDSSRVSTRPGYAIDYTGSGFSIHCVYRDGSEGIVGDQKNPCGDGPMLYQYVRDTTGKTNVVTYAFVRPN